MSSATASCGTRPREGDRHHHCTKHILPLHALTNTSRFTYLASKRLSPHASRFTPLASRLSLHTSRFTPLTSHLSLHASCFPHVSPHASRSTPLASHLSPHTVLVSHRS